MYSNLPNTFFFTATINSWHHLLMNDERKSIIINSLRYCVIEKRIQLHAFVIMPNHIHLILSLAATESQSSFQRDFLKFTAQQLIKKLMKNKAELNLYLSSEKERRHQIWERRPKWIPIENTLVLEQKLEYIHHNPLQPKWKLAELPETYKWSSASFYILNDASYKFITNCFI